MLGAGGQDGGGGEATKLNSSSGRNSTQSVGRASELRTDVDLIEKPFVPEQLLARVRAAIDRAADATTQATSPEGVSGGPTDQA
jgi:DNA-binding response OmpR family regulator